ncbi:MAG: hypothetical protein GY953_36965, partial [bacterium]|nr:hypothetical protein [bacterium]
NDFFGEIYDDGVPQWSTVSDGPFQAEVAADGELRPIGARMMEAAGMEGAFGTYRGGPDKINVYRFDFWNAWRLTYFVDEDRLLAEKRRFRWDHFLTGMHARGGFRQDSFLNDAWAVVVDVICVAMVIWIASGIYMWWLIRRSRLWGALALGGGLLCFVVFLVGL